MAKERENDGEFKQYNPTIPGKWNNQNLNNIDYRQYDPRGIFTNQNQGPMITNDNALATAFFNARYNYNPVDRSATLNRDDNWGSNAGAVQLFNVNAPLTRAFSSMSTPIKSTAFGHSEKIGMRDVLDQYMQQPQNVNNGGLERPSHYFQSNHPREQPQEILQNLVRNANQYRDYLQNQNAVVKMWSEYPACQRGDENCQDFIKNIFPPDSSYGYTVTGYNKEHNPKKIATDSLKDAYLAYMANLQPQNQNQEEKNGEHLPRVQQIRVNQNLPGQPQQKRLRTQKPLLSHILPPFKYNQLSAEQKASGKYTIQNQFKPPRPNAQNILGQQQYPQHGEEEKNDDFRSGGHVMKFKPRNGLSRYPRKSLANFIKTGRV